MTDLTKITTPFGLLDEETQRALKECGGPWELLGDDGWFDTGTPLFAGGNTYRQKPQPREYVAWGVVRPDGDMCIVYQFEDMARNFARGLDGYNVIKLTGRDDDRA